MHNLYTQYIVEASRTLINTVCNGEECFCNQSSEHGREKQIYVKKVPWFSKWFAFFQIRNLFHGWQCQISIWWVCQKRSTKKIETNVLSLIWGKSILMSFLVLILGLVPSTMTFGVFVNSFSPFHTARVSLKEDLASTKLFEIQISRKRHYWIKGYYMIFCSEMKKRYGSFWLLKILERAVGLLIRGKSWMKKKTKQ